MRDDRRIRVKKLALAFETGWEYVPESDEAGSVLTDIFLDMVEKNQERFKRIWEKQEAEFLQVVPESREEPKGCRGELLVKASEEEDGKWLEEGTGVYMSQEYSLQFQTIRPIRLTSAQLRYAVYRRGMWAWLSYEKGVSDPEQSAIFWSEGEELEHPVFRWFFEGLCDGKAEIDLEVVFPESHIPSSELSGTWTVSDGEHVFPVQWRQSAEGFTLEGKTPEFAGNLAGREYEICLSISQGEELSAEWLELLCGEFALKQPAQECVPDLCLTASGAGDGERVLPFGSSPEEASCLYLACDSLLAYGEGEITLRFGEDFREEEKLPAPLPEEYKKLYKKYPWLRVEQPLQDWHVEETQWEYFNGNMWRILPGSEAWKTGCGSEAGERICLWKRPGNMHPCTVEGEEHFYIRLRPVQVRDAYAAYYHKRIPVMEDIRFAAEERLFSIRRREVPAPDRIGVERMYLGFDREVTPDCCWYTGEGFCVFGREQMKGEKVLFGRKAFWVEVAEKGEETVSCLLPNYVPIQQCQGEKREREEGGRIKAGTAFYVAPGDMGILDAVCLSDIRYGGVRVPGEQEKAASEHYFNHYGRLLTPMDLELMLQERYPFLEVGACVYRRSEGTLDVELALTGRMWENDALGTREEAWEETQDALPEIQGWLEEAVSGKGPLWLQGCRVNCHMRETA